jgi:thiopurine S-methyltransferase
MHSHFTAAIISIFSHDLSMRCTIAVRWLRFQSRPFDALYDRGALVALPEDLRSRYVEHTNSLLKPGAMRLVITLEYDQSVVNGPPFSVSAEELTTYWDDLIRVGERDDIDNCPPKFRKAGLTDISEVFWLSR